MITIHSEDHKLRDSKTELAGGQLVEPFERPSRVEYILKEIHSRQLGDIRSPEQFGMDSIRQIHDADFIEFLSNAWTQWTKEGYKGEAIATCWPARRMSQRKPTQIDGLLGYYSLAAETAITKGTYEAALASVNVALTGADLINQGESVVFSLCRPPGHHAAIDMYGGYCFFNNAAIAAQRFLDNGARRVAILDVDYHHGNGTQDIFYDRNDVLFISLHANPQQEFPHFLGYADETGAGAGEGFNVNYSLDRGTGFDAWFAALEDAGKQILEYGADVLIISLGVDTFKEDPISHFTLESDDFTRYGSYLAGLQLPTLFVMEGGYAVQEIGINTVNVLSGFEAQG